MLAWVIAATALLLIAGPVVVGYLLRRDPDGTDPNLDEQTREILQDWTED